MMKRIIATFMIVVASVASIYAIDAITVLNTTIKKFKSDGIVEVNYGLKDHQGQTATGSITLNQSKFVLKSDALQCWFNGKTLWSYMPSSGEVNITTPTTEELSMVNPYSALLNLKSTSYLYMAYTQFPGTHTLKFVPKYKSSEIKQVLILVDKNSFRISKIYFEMKDGSSFTTTITSYKSKQKVKTGFFEFSKEKVPVGTEIVDLR